MGTITANINVRPYTNVLVEHDNPDTLIALLESEKFTTLLRAIDAAAGVAAALHELPEATVVSTPAPAPTPEPAANAGVWGSATPAPPAATPPPASNAGGFPQEKCIHGNRHYWASPDGKAKYWYCPLPKGAEGKCERVKAT